MITPAEAWPAPVMGLMLVESGGGWPRGESRGGPPAVGESGKVMSVQFEARMLKLPAELLHACSDVPPLGLESRTFTVMFGAGTSLVPVESSANRVPATANSVAPPYLS